MICKRGSISPYGSRYQLWKLSITGSTHDTVLDTRDFPWKLNEIQCIWVFQSFANRNHPSGWRTQERTPFATFVWGDVPDVLLRDHNDRAGEHTRNHRSITTRWKTPVWCLWPIQAIYSMKPGGESAHSPCFQSSSPRLLYISVDLAEVRGSLAVWYRECIMNDTEEFTI